MKRIYIKVGCHHYFDNGKSIVPYVEESSLKQRCREIRASSGLQSIRRLSRFIDFSEAFGK